MRALGFVWALGLCVWRWMALLWVLLLWALVLLGEVVKESWVVLPLQHPTAQVAMARPYVASSPVMGLFRGGTTSCGAARTRLGAVSPGTCRAVASVRAVSLRLRWCRSSVKPCGKYVRLRVEARALVSLRAQGARRRGYAGTVSVRTTGQIGRCVGFVA